MGFRPGLIPSAHPTLPAAPMVGPPHTQHSVLQLIKYQSVQSKVRLLYDREPQKSLSRDFIFPSARVGGTGCTPWVSWGNTEVLRTSAAT